MQHLVKCRQTLSMISPRPMTWEKKNSSPKDFGIPRLRTSAYVRSAKDLSTTMQRPLDLWGLAKEPPPPTRQGVHGARGAWNQTTTSWPSTREAGGRAGGSAQPKAKAAEFLQQAVSGQTGGARGVPSRPSIVPWPPPPPPLVVL